MMTPAHAALTSTLRSMPLCAQSRGPSTAGTGLGLIGTSNTGAGAGPAAGTREGLMGTSKPGPRGAATATAIREANSISCMFAILTVNMQLILFASLIAVAVAAPRGPGFEVPIKPSPVPVAGPAAAPAFEVPIKPTPVPAVDGPLLCAHNGMLRKVDVSAACAGVILPHPAIATPAAPVASNPSPLVQIVLNINQEASAAPVVAPTPVQAVDAAPIPVEPVQVVEIAPEPVQVIEVAPVPVIIGPPIIPSPAVSLPEELN
ncbi:unnamed protein product [Chrysodeixis includens]|uniref:Uncharacterized protein n=1 Tax=Chrysodeixis includens TaxID=689277 RepID=A0A9N8L2U0_CHRIL|nr:unnamed protein product [Chrysodeixis includens]